MTNYYYQTCNGKRVRVRKAMKASLKRDIKAGTTSAASSAGFVVRTGAGVSVARVISKNPVLKTAAMSLGAVVGATAGGILATRVIESENRLFSLRYPNLAEFMKEKSWKCGDSWISIRHKCYVDPLTGKTNYQKIKNPKTGRTKTVKVAVDYETYRKERAAALKKVGRLIRSNPSNLKPTDRELKLFNEVFDLRDKSRNKFIKDKNQKILNKSLKSAKLIKSDWKQISDFTSPKDRSADIMRSPVQVGKRSNKTLYKVGDNRIFMEAVEAGDFSRSKKKILEETNLLDIFKAQKVDFDAVKPRFYNVGFKVNNSYSYDGDIVRLENKSIIQTNIKITQAAAKAHNQILESLPDFSVLYNHPYLSDNKGLSREKLYRRIGYGTLDKSKSNIFQSLVKIGNKTYPLLRKIKK